MALNAKQQSAVREAALNEGIPAAFALGIVDKESAGRAFYTVKGEQLPAIRIEGHKVWKYTSGDIRKAAVAAGLASPTVGAVKNSRTMAGRYTQLGLLIRIVGRETAYMCISMGIGQVMGFNHAIVGYGSATAMFQAACTSFDNQVEQMLAFIANTPKALSNAQTLNYKGFALVYNGSNAKASYWIELEQFVQAYANENDPVAVNSYLDRIQALGYSTVMEFQSARGIKVDGIVGSITKEELDEAEAAVSKVEDRPANNAIKTAGGAVAVGTGTVLANNPDVLVSSVEYIEPVARGVSQLAPYGTIAILAGVVIVIAIAAFIYFKNRK